MKKKIFLVLFILFSGLNLFVMVLSENGSTQATPFTNQVFADGEGCSATFIVITTTVIISNQMYQVDCGDGRHKNCMRTISRTTTTCMSGGNQCCTPGSYDIITDYCGECV